MNPFRISIVICGLAAVFSMRCIAQEEPDPSRMSREQWQAQIRAARERSEAMRRERRFFVLPPPTSEELAEEASRKVLEDDSLRPVTSYQPIAAFFNFTDLPIENHGPTILCEFADNESSRAGCDTIVQNQPCVSGAL
jgi:hypothetical protein